MSAKISVELIFLGTGTSHGVPMIGCHCPVCESSDPHDKRMRTSVVIACNGVNVLIDTSPELRLQCIANRIDDIEAVVYTHSHADHIMGLDDLRSFNSVRAKKLGVREHDGILDAWANAATLAKLNEVFDYAFADFDPAQPGSRPYLRARTIDGPFEIARVRWTPIPLWHGTMPVLGFRVGDVAYCTDVSMIPDESFELLTGLDVLVLDCLRVRPHPTHFTVSQAVEAARLIKARRTLFTHITHELSHAAVNAGLPSGMELAYDGQRVGPTSLESGGKVR